MNQEEVIRNLEERINGNPEDASHQEKLTDDLAWIYESNDDDDEEKEEETIKQSDSVAPPTATDAASQEAQKKYFECISAKSSKFWEITLTGNEYTVRYGRIGKNGQKKTKSFSNSALAKEAFKKSIRKKITKGYKEKITWSAKPWASSEATYTICIAIQLHPSSQKCRPTTSYTYKTLDFPPRSC